MTQPQSQTKSSVSLLCIRGLGAMALGISAYLLYGSLTGERLAGCGPESGCDAVLRSRWAYLFGLPVSLPALLLYAAVLAVTVPRNSPAYTRAAERFLVCAGTAIIGAALYFTALQLFVIGSFCKFCMAAHACGLVAGLLILQRAVGPVPAASAEASRGRLLPWVLAGCLGVALLAGGQLVHRPKNFVVQSAAGLSERKVPRVLELHDQRFQIDLRETPLHGSPEASNVVVHLFDYTCPHCRALHPILKQAWINLSNQVAFASLLVPLASNCNHVVQRQLEQHRTACDLAYAGLAVWRVQRDQLPAFEDWVFSTTRLPLPEAARAKGRELVGTNQFNAALNDPWIQQHLTRNINLYTTNYLRFRKQVLPELMIGTNLVSGTIRDLPDLYKLLGEQFPLQIPQ